jgi:spore coat protein JB
MGMVNNTEKSKTLSNQLQSLAFAMTELGLYLDTHKDDTEALELFSAYNELYGELAAEYEEKVGPLQMRDAGENGLWNWTKNPWPWEYAANEEG